MKKTKRLLAWVLAICTLVGMPMAVSAVGTATPTEFKLLYAMEMPDAMAKSAADKGRTILLYFNSTPKASPDKLYFELVGYNSDGSLNITECMSVNTAYGQWGKSNPIAITIDKDMDGNFAEEQTLAARFARAGAVADQWSIVISQPDSTTAIADDSKLNGWTNTNGVTMAGDSSRRNAYIKADGVNYTKDHQPGTGDSLYCKITKKSALLTLNKAQRIDDTHIKLQMSESVHIDTERIRSSLRIVDASGKLMYVQQDGSYTATAGGSALEKTFALQASYKTDIYAYLNDTGITIGDYSIYEHLARMNEQDSNAGYRLRFTIGEAAVKPERGEYVNNGFVDTIWSAASGSNYTYKPLSGATYDGSRDRVYVEVDMLDQPPVKAEKIEVLSETQLRIVFSQAVKKTSENYSSLIRVTDADGYMAAMDPETFEVKNYTAADATWIQWAGTLTPATDAEYNTEWIWTLKMSTDRNRDGSVDTLSSIYDMWETNWKDQGLELNFAMESYGASRDGLINELVTETGQMVMNNREPNSKSGYPTWSDALHLSIAEDSFFANGLLQYESVKQTTTNQLIVTFNQSVVLQDVTTAKPFVGLRVVRAIDDVLIYASGKTITTGSAGKPQQWSAVSYTFLDDEQTQLLVTFADNVDIYSLVSKTAFGEPLSDVAYRVVFAIEEKINDDCAANDQDGLVWSIQTPAGKQLKGGTTAGQYQGWDGAYHDVDVIGPYDPVVIEDVTITGETTMEITFSEAIEYTAKTVWLRYVDPNTDLLYHHDELGYAQWKGRVEYADESQTKLIWTLYSVNHNKANANNIYDIVNFVGDIAAFKEWPGTFMICMEETANPVAGFIDTFHALSGKGIAASPYVPGSWDGLYYPIDISTVIPGDLKLESVVAYSDIEVIGTFSAPVAFAKSNPYVGLRLINADGVHMYISDTGEYTTATKNGDTAYAPVQWAFKWEYHNEEHTQVRYTLRGGTSNKVLPVQDVISILNYDWESVAPGCQIYFVIEEANADMITRNAHMDNVVLESNPLIKLDANHFAIARDAVKLTVSSDLEQQPLTSSARIINDLQIRVTFSRPVEFVGNPFMSIRYVDQNHVLYWNGIEELSTPIQYSGTWEWDNPSHTSLTWTMKGNGAYGANTVQDVVTRIGYLGRLYPGAKIMFCIEEATLKDEITVCGFNGVIDNIADRSGRYHLTASTPHLLDRHFMALNTNIFAGNKNLELLSVKAMDDQTLEIKFSDAVTFAEGDAAPSMAIRYLSPSGDSEVLTDGKTAIFKGDWEYADQTKTTLIWKLNSKHAENLSDIFQYAGNLKWNSNAIISFVIMDAENYTAPMATKKLSGVMTADGLHHLSATYIGKDFISVQKEIEICYDLPAVTVEPLTEIEYVTDYLWYIIGAGAILTVFVIITILLSTKRRKDEE